MINIKKYINNIMNNNIPINQEKGLYYTHPDMSDNNINAHNNILFENHPQSTRLNSNIDNKTQPIFNNVMFQVNRNNNQLFESYPTNTRIDFNITV